MRTAFIITLIAFQVLLIFVHLAVYATLSAAFGFDGMVTRLIFIALALTFTTASLLVHWFRNRLIQWYYAFAAYWFGLVHFLLIGGSAFFFALIVATDLNWYFNYALVGGICFGIAFALHLYGTWNSGRAEITRISVNIPDTPEFWKQHPIVFVSDIHLGAIRGAKFMQKVVSRIGSLRPAAVFIGGDIYDGVKCDAKAIIAPLAGLDAPRGVYFITGNHEYYGDIDRYIAAIRSCGVRILNNEMVDIEGIQFVGIDDASTHKRNEYAAILSAIVLEKNKPAIVLKHEPNHIDLAEQKGFSLSLSGHTHNGQIFPLNYIVKSMYYGFHYGLNQYKKMAVYTSSGVGTWGPPLRLGTKSEIVVVKFV